MTKTNSHIQRSKTHWLIASSILVTASGACALACFLADPSPSAPETSGRNEAISIATASTRSQTNTAPLRQPTHAPPPPTVASDPQALALELAKEYRKGKSNIFFDEQQFVAEVAANQQVIEALEQHLATTESIERLAPDVEFVVERPPEVLDRIEALDLLIDVGKIEQAGQEALEELLLAPIDDALSEHVQRVLMAEKFEILESVSATDRERGTQLLAQFDHPDMRRILAAAIDEPSPDPDAGL